MDHIHLLCLLLLVLIYRSFSSSILATTSPLFPRMSLQQFLRRSRALVTSATVVETNRKTAVVIGNEAADADSIISALTYAYLKQSDYQDVIPVCCIPREDLPLRRDVEILLETTGIGINELICIDDCKCLFDSSTDATPLILVDHNKIWDGLPRSCCKITEIVDHHLDLGDHAEVSGEFREIAFEDGAATVGSCCTLISERFMKSESLKLDETVATLLMGVIVLDTLNMSPAYDRGTKRDADALLKLSSISSCNLDELFNRLKDAKNDRVFWSSLKAIDCLRIDFKVFSSSQSSSSTSVGISSCLLPAHEFLSKLDIIDAVDAYLKRNELLVVMFLYSNPEPVRELVLFSKKAEQMERIREYFREKGKLFEFRPLEEGLNGSLGLTTDVSVLSFAQENSKASRKQFAPFIIDFISWDSGRC